MNSDCPPNAACLSSHCRDPCPGVCGINAECTVVNHIPVCTCFPDHIGDPFQSCRRKPVVRKYPFERISKPKNFTFYDGFFFFLQLLYQRIPASLRHVGRIVIVKLVIHTHYALAMLLSSENHRTVDPSAWSVRNVVQVWLVSLRNAQIPAPEPVDFMPAVPSSITIQFAVALPILLAIRSYDVYKRVSKFFNLYRPKIRLDEKKFNDILLKKRTRNLEKNVVYTDKPQRGNWLRSNF